MRRLKKTSGKGQRWKKGQSCITNPENTKYRDSARGAFFQKLDGTSNLTQDAVAQHEANFRIPAAPKQSVKSVRSVAKSEGTAHGRITTAGTLVGKSAEAAEGLERQMEELSVDEDDLKSGGASFNTFATNITTCTIPAFEKFFRNFSVESELHTRMLAIHAAAQEYLKESNTPETSTSYFCSLLVSLEGVCDSEADVAAVLGLMARVVRRVTPAVLRARFGVTAAALNNIITRYQDSDNTTLITNALGTLSVVLRAQDRSQWTYSSTNNLLDKLLFFTTHSKPKIRKSAQYNVGSVLTASSFITEEKEKLQEEQDKKQDQMEQEGSSGIPDQTKISVLHPAAGHVADYCLNQLQAATQTDNTKTRLHLLVLLRQIIMAFPRKKVKLACERLLSLLQLGGSLTHTSSLQAIYALLKSHPSPSVLPLETNKALLSALTGQGSAAANVIAVVPGKNDVQMAGAWITVVTVAVLNICKLSRGEGIETMATWVEKVAPYWQSSHSDVHTKVNESIVAVVEECYSGDHNTTAAPDHEPAASAVFRILQGALSFQYQPAWGSVFQTIGSVLESLGPHYTHLAMPVLRILCPLMLKSDVPHRGALERALGCGVRALGPKALLDVIPLSITGNMKDDEPTFWTLPLVSRHTGSGAAGSVKPKLSYFVSYLVPRAVRCHQLTSQLSSQAAPGPLLARTYQTVERQIWGSLPGWCRGSEGQDIEAALTGNQATFAKLLREHIQRRPDTRTTILEALRVLLNRSEPLTCMKTFGQNYLPVLFNVYLSGTSSTTDASNKSSEDRPSNGQRQAALSTLRLYVMVADGKLVTDKLTDILSKYQETEGDPGRRQALLDLARTLLPRLDQNGLSQLYDTLTKALHGETKGVGGHKEQKAAYRLLEELLATKTDAAGELLSGRMEDISGLLSGGLTTAAPPSRAPRLRCLVHLLNRLPIDNLMAPERVEGLVTQVVGEAVGCCGKQMSRATRTAALGLINAAGAAMQRTGELSSEDTVRAGIKLLLGGLAGSDTLIANTLTAITALTFTYKDVMPQDALTQLVSSTCALLKCPTRELVGSCLSFLKSVLVIFPPQVTAGHVEGLVRAICGMKEDCQRNFRLKTRDIMDRLIRKFGADYITSLVPKDSVMYKRVRNLRKAAARKQRDRDSQREEDDNAEDNDEFETRAAPASLEEILAEIDTDDEDEDDDDDKKKKKNIKKKGGKKEEKKTKNKKTTWIKEEDEEIVDLLDPSAGQSIVSSGSKGVTGGAVRKGGSFKIDKDTGKLIIAEPKSSTDDDDKKMDFSEDLDEYLGLKSGAAGGRISQTGVKRSRTISEGSSQPGNTQSVTGSTGGSGRSSAAAKNTTTTSSTKQPNTNNKNKKKKKFDYGSEFRSGRAGGDMTGKGQIAPYAYVKLSKERLNRRKAAKYEGQFTSLVRGAKRGVATGARRKAGKGAGGGKKKKK